jgi:hypothetical protein
MTKRRIALFMCLALASGDLLAIGADESPHARAIQLVMQILPDHIRALDPAFDAWHDTRTRTWSVRRPVAPGFLDTAHVFQVSYAVDGKVVGTWSVNTQTGQVARPGETFRIE